MEQPHPGSVKTEKRFGCLQVFGILLVVVIVTATVTFFVLKAFLFPSAFNPVTLNPKEEKVLAAKLEELQDMGSSASSEMKGASVKPSTPKKGDPMPPLEPEAYSEKGLSREIEFTEKEINAMLAKNTDLAQKLAIDLSDDLISAKLHLPVDPDFPILGGKILRLRSGLVFSYNNGKPVVILKGVTVMGVPVPNAWLGGIKDIDLVERFGAEQGFWKSFSDGIQDIEVEDGSLKIKLKD